MLVIVAMVVGGFVINIVFFPVNTATKLVGIAYDAQDKVLNADNAIYNYEWFKQAKANIDAAKKQFADAQDNLNLFKTTSSARDSWTFEDKQEAARLSAVAQGLGNYLTGLIADYNARASMATRNIFQDHVLPNYIDALTFIRQ